MVERFSGYSVLGHLDLIRRYDPEGVYPFESNRDAIAAIWSEPFRTARASRSTGRASATAFPTSSPAPRSLSSIATSADAS